MVIYGHAYFQSILSKIIFLWLNQKYKYIRINYSFKYRNANFDTFVEKKKSILVEEKN